MSSRFGTNVPLYNITNNNEECDGTLQEGDWGSITSCSDFDEFTGGSLSCDNNCMFNTSLCTGGPGGEIPPTIGSCTYNEDTSDDNCDDGFLTYSWTATWTWSPENVGKNPPCESDYVLDLGDNKCYYDPNKASENCVGGEKTTPCPAQLELPFFGWKNFLITIIVLVLIYWAWNLRKKKIYKKRKVSRKKK